MNSEIADFYRGQSVFISGATGFLGKVLVEKLLRSCGEIKYIYVLIRSKRGQNVNQRLISLLGAKIFAKLIECEPQTLLKIIAIEGDITSPGLGISEENLKTLAREVSVVFHSAATVRFDEPLRTAVNFNVLGTRRVIELCHKLPKLLALIHVSTAYSNCNKNIIEERVYPSPVSPQEVIDLCEAGNQLLLDAITPQLLEGYPNTYTFTKALAESLLIEECGHIPVVIVRPSIVTSSWKEPLPGWVDSFTGVTGFMVALGMGVLRQVNYNPNIRADFIPVDSVINLMIAIVWLSATQRPNGIQVFNCTSGSLNPIIWEEVMTYSSSASIKYPSSKIYRYPSLYGTHSELINKVLIFFDHIIPAYLYDGLMYLLGRKRTMVDTYNHIHQTWNMLSWFGLRNFQFVNDNALLLGQMLEADDQEIFGFDIRSMDWSKYLADYCLGTRQFILKESNETLPKARDNLRRVYFRDIIITGSLIILLIIFLYSIIFKFNQH